MLAPITGLPSVASVIFPRSEALSTGGLAATPKQRHRNDNKMYNCFILIVFLGLFLLISIASTKIVQLFQPHK